MNKCIQCDDNIIVEGEGCPKCVNRFCGSCCGEIARKEWLESLQQGDDGTGFEGDGVSLMCGDHLTPIDDCGCKL